MIGGVFQKCNFVCAEYDAEQRRDSKANLGGMGSPKPSSGYSVNPAFNPILWFNISKVETYLGPNKSHASGATQPT